MDFYNEKGGEGNTSSSVSKMVFVWLKLRKLLQIKCNIQRILYISVIRKCSPKTVLETLLSYFLKGLKSYIFKEIIRILKFYEHGQFNIELQGVIFSFNIEPQQWRSDIFFVTTEWYRIRAMWIVSRLQLKVLSYKHHAVV